MSEGIRWKRRCDTFLLALKMLSTAVELAGTRELSALEKLGLIHEFEFTHELACQVLKDYLEYKGIQNLTGPRDAVRAAFKNALIENGETWMAMIQDGTARPTPTTKRQRARSPTASSPNIIPSSWPWSKNWGKSLNNPSMTDAPRAERSDH